MTTHLRFLCGVAGLIVASSVWADTSWTLAASGSVTSGGVAETTTGWANTNGTGVSPVTATSLYTLEQQTAPGNMELYAGGLGINNLDGCGSAATGTAGQGGTSCDVADLASIAPEHAIDNDQRNEMALLQFGTKTRLTTATFGWTGADADVSVMAWMGSGAPPSLTGATWGALPSGWTTVGNYTTLAHNSTSDQTLAINSGGIVSSYWLIGAYNALAAGTKDTTGALMDGNSDYVKIKAVTGKIPEPGTLALLGLGLVGFFYTSRRRPWA
jgi:hypothetical protein